MKALTICQPFAHLVASGERPIENRNWPTSYRGPLLIHAGKSREWMDEDDQERYPDMVFGAIVAIATLVECIDDRNEMRVWPEPYRDLRDHEHANGPFCWILENVRRLPAPIPCRGAQGLWIPAAEIMGAVSAGLVEAADVGVTRTDGDRRHLLRRAAVAGDAGAGPWAERDAALHRCRRKAGERRRFLCPRVGGAALLGRRRQACRPCAKLFVPVRPVFS